MKQLPFTVTPPPSRVTQWGRWLQTVLLVSLLLLLFQQFNLLPPTEGSSISASEQRGLHVPAVVQAKSTRL
ncbi:hypothetical protein FNT36_14335 [Hymenobacter setariae]|uniref:Uncharacterized protein n=1 Tax=Hymenobacter setariae TaxID=2594794 RepID=A0A558BW17_9BACT|nr:hypothetical protein [Hymenobacter setariae]TVT40643.1 hypothetical protein FNT36_14335 [Hymenobacter setariae]